MHLNILRKINMFDNYILFSIKKYVQNKYLDMLMPIVTDMGNLGIVWIIIAIILILDKPYRMVGSVVILTLIVSTIAGEGIVKHIVRRTRPCNQQNSLNLLISKPISYSFPSGHTLSSFAAAEVLSMYFTEYKLIFIGIAFLIALSRMYLYVHYPTDVIAGVILGILCSKLIFIILQEGFMEKVAMFYQNIL
ncbi:phosphatase PAP2 family protein [Clostridium autoethanogenum]|uniref:Phosphatase PAP2 family protein n=2 Tax=Clostridium autoethanogenum TaxID=84023 RepID=A0A3M0SNX7_9CLOT|nr:phosphatase PAP2 family protein [Clostridium autoethanogenum]AGY77894.1 phosphatase PAP2 family protein [Clostridium autoethanogenum DSM 10061]ALU38028.1 putative phosphatase [Clostridium autoethanogenum DSM 10061]OVY50792.1 undecaprenyl pyrophosphate phosphatase [Clostridium autoethanogenum]RMD00189.1 phosphatase PAP2 family protein [Clostridium autoethanogenum]